MHRHLYQIYTDADTPRISEATKSFKTLLSNTNDLSNVYCLDHILSDVIAEYLIDTKLYIRSDYNPKRARTLLENLPPLSNNMSNYIKDIIYPDLQTQSEKAKREYQVSLEEYKNKYKEDRDYPIYVKTLGAKEKYEKNKLHLSQAEEVVEWLIKTKSSSEDLILSLSV